MKRKIFILLIYNFFSMYLPERYIYVSYSTYTEMAEDLASRIANVSMLMLTN
jgi:hypothetical protein